jgi:hypothetical protein
MKWSSELGVDQLAVAAGARPAHGAQIASSMASAICTWILDQHTQTTHLPAKSTVTCIFHNTLPRVWIEERVINGLVSWPRIVVRSDEKRPAGTLASRLVVQ